ncbi:IS629 ORF2 [Shigella sonnei]|nr:IS629 ORF2 [Shigella sonnei]
MEHGARLSTSRVMAIAFIFMSVLIVLSLSVNLIQGVNNYRLQNEQRTAVTLYKAEVIHRKSWKNRTEVELATLTWVDWYNNRRLLERLGHTPPAEAEKAYYASIGNDDLAA